MKYIPYTYLIGWSKLNKYYYGVRYAKNCHPSDLWTKYFTSSKYVKQFREENGEPDIIQIRRTFNSKEKAINWELRVLRKLNVLDNDKWLNKNISGNYKTTESVPNKLKNRTFNDVYGNNKSYSWKRSISISSKNWWNSSKGILRKEKLSSSIQSKFTTKGLEPYNKIKETFVLKCEFCSKEKELTKTKSNLNKKTCGSKSCTAKWCHKYKRN